MIPTEMLKQTKAEAALEKKEAKELRNHLEVQRSEEPSFLVVLAIGKNPKLNGVKRVPAKRGVPIGGYVYDTVSDCYLLDCADYMILGYVGVSYRLQVKNHPNWSTVVPMPEAIVKRHLNASQKNELKKFVSLYEELDYTYEFVQLVSPH